MPIAKIDVASADYKVYFDGGYRRKVASGGYLLFDRTGSLVDGQALYFGYGYTNNEVEAMACRALHESIAMVVPPGSRVVLFGDSALVMGFLTQVSKPGKAFLLTIVR